MNKAELVIAIAEKTQMTKKDSEAALVAALAGSLVIVMHWGNLRRAISGEDPVRTRSGLKKIFEKNK